MRSYKFFDALLKPYLLYRRVVTWV